MFILEPHVTIAQGLGAEGRRDNVGGLGGGGRAGGAGQPGGGLGRNNAAGGFDGLAPEPRRASGAVEQRPRIVFTGHRGAAGADGLTIAPGIQTLRIVRAEAIIARGGTASIPRGAAILGTRFGTRFIPYVGLGVSAADVTAGFIPESWGVVPHWYRSPAPNPADIFNSEIQLDIRDVQGRLVGLNGQPAIQRPIRNNVPLELAHSDCQHGVLSEDGQSVSMTLEVYMRRVLQIPEADITVLKRLAESDSPNALRDFRSRLTILTGANLEGNEPHGGNRPRELANQVAQGLTHYHNERSRATRAPYVNAACTGGGVVAGALIGAALTSWSGPGAIVGAGIGAAVGGIISLFW